MGPQLRQRDWPEHRQFAWDRTRKGGPVAQAWWGRGERALLTVSVQWEGGHELSVLSKVSPLEENVFLDCMTY